MFQSNKIYYIVFLSSLILCPSLHIGFSMIINGFYKFSDVIVTLILFFVVGFIPALITTSTSIKFRNKFLQESSNLNLTKIKWLSYSIISGVLVSALMPFIIAFLFNGLGEIRVLSH